MPLWDPPAAAGAVDGNRDPLDQNSRMGWEWTAGGVAGQLVTAPPAGSTSRAPWTITRVLGSSADERGAPLRLSAIRGGAIDDSPLDPPLVFPGSASFAIIPDSLKNSTGSPLDSPVVRLANAWSLQSFRIISGDLPQPRPTLVSHRDVRDRLALFMPFFAQGRDIQPLLVGDTLFWAIDLYSVSDTYPLSRRAMLVGDERSYMHHAAVGVIQASTGDVTVVPDSILDPIASSWVRRLPTLFGNWNALPLGLRAQISAPSDALYAQAAAYGRYGSRTDSTIATMRLPTLDGSDTSLTTADLPVILPATKTLSLIIPLVDESDRVRGLLIGAGGSAHLTMWYPLTTPGPRWSAVIDRLRSVDTVGGASREGALAHGRIRAVPVRGDGGVGFIQPSYHWRPAPIPALNRVALLVGDTTRSVAPGALQGAAPTAPTTPSGASAASLYDAMRDAMRRGDWTAFGRAFDALGRALGRAHTP